MKRPMTLANQLEMPADASPAEQSLSHRNNAMPVLNTDEAVLIVVDVQGALASLMHNKDYLFRNIRGLIKGFQILGLPVLCSEQMPHKLGPTVDEIKGEFEGFNPIGKSSFSCMKDAEFYRIFKTCARRQAVVCGIEAHVCVHQTITDLLGADIEVHVPADAVSSRGAHNLTIALDRMKQEGAWISSTQMVLCELLKSADHPRFKDILALLKSS